MDSLLIQGQHQRRFWRQQVLIWRSHVVQWSSRVVRRWVPGSRLERLESLDGLQYCRTCLSHYWSNPVVEKWRKSHDEQKWFKRIGLFQSLLWSVCNILKHELKSVMSRLRKCFFKRDHLAGSSICDSGDLEGFGFFRHFLLSHLFLSIQFVIYVNTGNSLLKQSTIKIKSNYISSVSLNVFCSHFSDSEGFSFAVNGHQFFLTRLNINITLRSTV